MIDFLNIKTFSPSKEIIFPLKRKVLIEKYSEILSVSKDFEHLRKTILNPGEFIFTIDKDSLVIEKFIISTVPNSFHPNGKIILFNNKGEPQFELILMQYLASINENSIDGIFFKGTGGRRIICSSERCLLKKLQNYIPILMHQTQTSILNKNLSSYKVKNQKSKLKELEQFQKQINKFLK